MNTKKLWKVILAIVFTIVMIFAGLWLWTTFFNVDDDIYVIVAYMSSFIIGGLYITGISKIIDWILKDK